MGFITIYMYNIMFIDEYIIIVVVLYKYIKYYKI